MACRWVPDKEVGRFFVPGCMGAAVYGPRGCTCGSGKRRRELEDRITKLEERIAVLEKERA